MSKFDWCLENSTVAVHSLPKDALLNLMSAAYDSRGKYIMHKHTCVYEPTESTGTQEAALLYAYVITDTVAINDATSMSIDVYKESPALSTLLLVLEELSYNLKRYCAIKDWQAGWNDDGTIFRCTDYTDKDLLHITVAPKGDGCELQLQLAPRQVMDFTSKLADCFVLMKMGTNSMKAGAISTVYAIHAAKLPYSSNTLYRFVHELQADTPLTFYALYDQLYTQAAYDYLIVKAGECKMSFHTPFTVAIDACSKVQKNTIGEMENPNLYLRVADKMIDMPHVLIGDIHQLQLGTLCVDAQSLNSCALSYRFSPLACDVTCTEPIDGLSFIRRPNRGRSFVEHMLVCTPDEVDSLKLAVQMLCNTIGIDTVKRELYTTADKLGVPRRIVDPWLP